jgi:hypothetical protein
MFYFLGSAKVDRPFARISIVTVKYGCDWAMAQRFFGIVSYVIILRGLELTLVSDKEPQKSNEVF